MRYSADELSLDFSPPFGRVLHIDDHDQQDSRSQHEDDYKHDRNDLRGDALIDQLIIPIHLDDLVGVGRGADAESFSGRYSRKDLPYMLAVFLIV